MGEAIDIELEEGTERDGRLDIIDTQLHILASVAELDDNLYNKALEDKIRVVSDALNLINKIQKQLIKEI